MLSDGSSIFTFHQIQESEGYDEFIPSTVHVLYGADKKVMKVDSLGEVVFITG